jgi:iron-sulfur cluster assembly accessory protein
MPVLRAPGPADGDPFDVGRGGAAGPPGVVFTDAAMSVVEGLLSRESRAGVRLRVAARPGGCAALRYQLYFDDRLSGGDVIASGADAAGRRSWFEVVIDPASLRCLAGATIDYAHELQRQGFVISSPSATGSCACADCSA